MLNLTAIALAACLFGQATPAPAPVTPAPAAPVASAPAKPVIETAEIVGAPKAAAPAPGAATSSTAAQQLPPSGGTAQPQQNPMSMLYMIGGMVLVMIVVTSFTGRKQKKKTQELLDSLKNNDKVQTTSGIIGTIAEIRDNEVVLRVDESSNTRIRFNKMAIQQVLRPAGGKDTTGNLPIETKTGNQKAAV